MIFVWMSNHAAPMAAFRVLDQTDQGPDGVRLVEQPIAQPRSSLTKSARLRHLDSIATAVSRGTSACINNNATKQAELARTKIGTYCLVLGIGYKRAAAKRHNKRKKAGVLRLLRLFVAGVSVVLPAA